MRSPSSRETQACAQSHTAGECAHARMIQCCRCTCPTRSHQEILHSCNCGLQTCKPAPSQLIAWLRAVRTSGLELACSSASRDRVLRRDSCVWQSQLRESAARMKLLWAAVGAWSIAHLGSTPCVAAFEVCYRGVPNKSIDASIWPGSFPRPNSTHHVPNYKHRLPRPPTPQASSRVTRRTTNNRGLAKSRNCL